MRYGPSNKIQFQAICTLAKFYSKIHQLLHHALPLTLAPWPNKNNPIYSCVILVPKASKATTTLGIVVQ
jgi:hypothetical protein